MRELSVIGPVLGVLLQHIPLAAYRLLWDIVGNKAKAQARALKLWILLFFHLYFLTLLVVSSFSVLKILHFTDYWPLKTGHYVCLVVPNPKTNHYVSCFTDVCTELSNQPTATLTAWQMSLVHLLGFIVEDSCLWDLWEIHGILSSLDYT